MNWLFDLRYAFRNLIKSTSFTLLTIFVMTAGLGASIYIIPIVKNYAYDPIDFPEGERVMTISRRVGDQWRQTLLLDYQVVKEESKSFELICAYSDHSVILRDEFKSIRYSGTYVTNDFFKVTGIGVARGRLLSEADQIPGSLPVVVLSHTIWQNHFGGDENILGKKIHINQSAYEVVGVAKPDTAHPFEDTMWMPLQQNARTIKLKHSPAVTFYGRLKPGISQQNAQQEVQSIFANHPEPVVKKGQKIRVLIDPVKQKNLGRAVKIFNILLHAGICLLVLCCINVGNLLLARSNGRLQEIAIRLALGAPRVKLISQQMWEVALICLAGGILAIFLAGWGVQTTQQFFLERGVYLGFPTWAHLHFGIGEIFLGVAVTLLSIFLVGFIPAWRATQCDFNAILKDGSKTSLGKKSGWISNLLVNIQISLSCVLMAVAGVLFLLIQQTIAEGYGVSLDHHISGRVEPSRASYPNDEAIASYFDRLLQEARKIPGVEKASLISSLPTEWSWSSNIEVEGQAWDTKNALRINLIAAYPGAFDTLEIPLLEGRLFDHHDNKDAPSVVVISQSLAAKLWPRESPIGKRLRSHADRSDRPGKWLTVIGVVPHIVQRELFDDDRTPNIYAPFAQETRKALALVLKTSVDPASLTEKMVNISRKVDPNTPMYLNLPLSVQAKGLSMIPDLAKTVLAVFATCALLITVTGIYGIVANHIKRRTQEIGIRRALGVPESAIHRLLLRQCLAQLIAGLLLGLPLGYVFSELLVSKFAGGNTGSPVVYISVPAIILAAMLAATWVPMVSALRRSPAAALRHE